MNTCQFAYIYKYSLAICVFAYADIKLQTQNKAQSALKVNSKNIRQNNDYKIEKSIKC